MSDLRDRQVSSTNRAAGRARRGLACLVLLPLAAISAGCRERELPPAVPQLLKATVAAEALPAEVEKEKERARAWEEMKRFYAQRNWQPAWNDARGPLPRAEELLAAFDLAAAEGMDPRRYGRERLAARIERVRRDGRDLDDPGAQRRLVDLDVNLTYTFLTFASHLATGRLQPATLETQWYTKPRNVDLDAALARALADAEDRSLVRALEGLRPPGEGYARLRDALARYQEIARAGGWPRVPAGPELKKGGTGERVQLLRQRLAAGGDLQEEQGAAFDAAVEAAVRRFQRRHGLEETGIVDHETLAVLNVPAADRVRQIAVNMERWRWLPSDLGERHILVNVPELELALVEGGRETMRMRVIVGKEQSRTPVFSDRMTYIELNPAWNLPTSIVRDEVLPALGGNPYGLAGKDMEVVKGWGDEEVVVDPSAVDLAELGRDGAPYRLRQRPGPGNPLGRIKFMFPNRFDVYLHDTPADHLFDESERDFSHGCIRVERPLDLASHLLRGDPKWTREEIQAALASGESDTVSLPRPLPVHIVYFTAWANADGTVELRPDLYGHDTRLAEALAAEPPLELDLEAVRREVRAAR